jgi:hypothetical protein
MSTRKKLVIDTTEASHAKIKASAASKGETISNRARDLINKGYGAEQDVDSAMELLRELIPNPSMVRIER